MSDRPVNELPVKTAAQLTLTDFLLGHDGGVPAAFQTALAEAVEFFGTQIAAGDYIVERGGNDDAFYVRFANGIQICVTQRTGLAAVNSSFGGGYILLVSATSWPAAFAAAPKAFAFPHKTTGNAPIWAGGGTGPATTTNTQAIWLNVWSSTSDTDNVVVYLGLGRWK